MSAETTDAQPTPRTSSRFGDESAPGVVPFVSSDGMRLYIERAKLEREADAFPPPSATLDPGEVIPLEEDGDTLELLFRFVDREEYVRLEDVKFELLSRVAEAAHKYRVYSAMSHGHSDIADAAAPYTVGSRADEMLKALPSHQEYIRWPSEPVFLDEDAETLELMFRYVYLEIPIDLNPLPFSLAEKLAEASHKYIVHTAIVACHAYMMSHASENSLEVISFAARYDYKDIIDAVAPYIIGAPLSTIRRILPTPFVLPWVIFNNDIPMRRARSGRSNHQFRRALLA
ncbi:hypothetical protein EV122DRAFT_283103 [Schizophyllum commune]